MRYLLPAILALTCAAGLPTAAAADDQTPLEIKRVALFSSGVGFFECEATVNGTATATLDFRTEQINDILKSLVVQDLGGGHVGVVSYASQDPIEKTLRSFGVDLTGKPTLAELLDQLRGEPVALSGGREIRGIILGVQEQKRLSDSGEVVEMVELLTIATANGLERVLLSQLTSIKLLNDDVNEELNKALATLARAHDADKKTVELTFRGDGRRRVRVAYLLEAPIWKTSYRLGLSEDEQPYLQGWATVDNATEDDWNNVELALVSGRPISFRMDLYTPLYVPRPVEELELYASLRPPDYEGGFAVPEKAVPASPVARQAGRGGRMRGAQVMDEVSVARQQLEYNTAARAPQADPKSAPARMGSWAEVPSVATAAEAGELFEYRIDTPVSIQRQNSALLPIVNERIEADKLSIYNPQTHQKHPLNGLELKNTTGLNLMQGPVTVFDGGTYAGDAMLPNLAPDEERFVAYALDLSTEIMVQREPAPDQITSLWIAKGVLWHRHKYVDERTYLIKNKAERERQVVLEQQYADQWKLVAPDEPYERTENLLRFKIEAPAQQTARFPVRLEYVADQQLALTNAGSDQIRIYLRASAISPAVKEALQQVVVLRSELDKLERRRERLERERNETINEQERVRDNLKVLDRNTDAYQRQLKIFDELETQISNLKQQVAQARDAEQQQRQQLGDYLLGLNVE